MQKTTISRVKAAKVWTQPCPLSSVFLVRSPWFGLLGGCHQRDQQQHCRHHVRVPPVAARHHHHRCCHRRLPPSLPHPPSPAARCRSRPAAACGANACATAPCCAAPADPSWRSPRLQQNGSSGLWHAATPCQAPPRDFAIVTTDRPYTSMYMICTRVDMSEYTSLYMYVARCCPGSSGDHLKTYSA